MLRRIFLKPTECIKSIKQIKKIIQKNCLKIVSRKSGKGLSGLRDLQKKVSPEPENSPKTWSCFGGAEIEKLQIQKEKGKKLIKSSKSDSKKRKKPYFKRRGLSI